MSFSKVKRLSAFVCNSVILSNSVIRYKRLQIRTSSSDILDQYHHYKLHPSSFKNFISSCPWFLKSVIECSFHKPKHLWVPWPHQVTNDHTDHKWPQNGSFGLYWCSHVFIAMSSTLVTPCHFINLYVSFFINGLSSMTTNAQQTPPLSLMATLFNFSPPLPLMTKCQLLSHQELHNVQKWILEYCLSSC